MFGEHATELFAGLLAIGVRKRHRLEHTHRGWLACSSS
jgi:hypothetical protein